MKSFARRLDARVVLLPLPLLLAHCGVLGNAAVDASVAVTPDAGPAPRADVPIAVDAPTALDAQTDDVPPAADAPPVDDAAPSTVDAPTITDDVPPVVDTPPATTDVPPPVDVPVPCEAPAQRCDGACVSVATSSQHCGACGVVCHGVCAAGACNPMVDLVAGAGFNCARLMDGAVRCWGANDRGQLGDGTTRARTRPTPVTLPGPAAELAAGDEFACARLNDGRVFCWGDNRSGQLGRGSFDPDPMPTPAAVAGLTTAASLVTGTRHACVAVDATGANARAVRCWGNGEVGQTGRGTTAHTNAPTEDVRFGALNGPYANLVSGGDRTCVQRNFLNGGWACWGRNIEGELGLPLGHDAFTTPVLVPALSSAAVSTVQRPASGGRHFCTINYAMRVMCDGLDEAGQVGGGTPDPATGFRQAPSVGAAMRVVAGRAHTCALLNPGGRPTSVTCWGDNLGGQAGSGSSEPVASPGAPVVGIPVSVFRLAAGRDHTCAWALDGAAWCWGIDTTGFIAPGADARRATAMPVVW
jgi:alpha-tubulin suppressor-like RCC1 family protein